MERIAASGLAVFMVLSAGACKQMTEPSGEEGPTEQPAAATERTTEPPLTGWVPRKRNVQPSEVALVKTEDVVKEGKTKKPNILIIWGDDIGYWNISAYKWA